MKTTPLRQEGIDINVFERQQLCPHCGYLLTATTEAVGQSKVPQKGDISLCIKCGNPSLFGDVEFEKVSDDDLRAHLRDDPDTLATCMRIRDAIQCLPRDDRKETTN